MAPARGSARVLAALNQAIGAAHVVTDPEVLARFTTDWTGRFGGPALAAVRPGSVEEVAAVVGACATEGVAVVPQGGNTGLVGGGVPRVDLPPPVVLSTDRLAELGVVDVEAGQVTAGAGVTLGSLQQAAGAAGWRYPVDFGSRDLATVGGMVATNAGGVSVFRHGSTRRQVLGIEMVMADGSIASRLDGLVKDNTGFDLGALVCGSEGTLGVVTAARLRLLPAPRRRLAAWVTQPMLAGAMTLARDASRLPDVEAVELIAPECLALLAARGHHVPGGADGWAVLIEAASTWDRDPEGIDELLGDLDAVALALDDRLRRTMWDLRDAVPEAIRGDGVPLKFDVAVPVPVLGQFLEELVGVVAAADPGARLWRFGHAADGNVHVNLTGEALAESQLEDAVLGLVLAAGGSISAEHGIGVAKAAWMDRARSPAELAAMRHVKSAFDPGGILNPGVFGL